MTDDGAGRQWSTAALALIVTAAGTLLGGLGTFIGSVFGGGDDPGGSETRPATTVTSFVTVTQTGAARPTGTQRTARARTPAKNVRWQGNVLVTENETDLDPVPADNNAESGGDIQDYGFLYVSADSLRWTASADPTEQQCTAQLRTHAETENQYDDPTPGMRICLRTDGGRIALVTVKKAASSGHNVDVVVWKGPDG